jgi:outer membrane cobalamin receptor
MKTLNIKAGLMIFVLMSAVVSGAAETAAATENVWDMSLEQLMNVDVRTAATLTESNPHKSPSSVTVITAQDIAVTPARNLLDLIEIYVPGAIYMNHSIGPVFGIRGALVDRPYQYLVTVNGVNVNYKAHYGARLELLNWDMNDIQCVEIIRGPGSVTYGPGAVGGVINIVTKKASDAPGVSAGGFFWDKYDSVGEYASYGHVSEKFDAFAYVSTVSTNGVEPDLFSVNATRSGYLGHEDAPSYPSPAATYMSDYFDEPQIKAHVDLDFKNGWRFWARYVTSSTALMQSSAIQYDIDGKYRDYRQTRHRYMEYALENKNPLNEDTDLKSLFSFSSKDTQDIQKYTTATGTGNKLRNAGWMWSENTFFTRVMLDYHPDTNIKAATGVEYSYDEIGPAWGKDRNDGLRLNTNIISGPNSDAYGAGTNQIPGTSPSYFAVGHGWSTASYAVFGETNIQVNDQHSMLLSARVDKHSYTDYMFSPRAAWIYEMQPKHFLKFIAQRSVRMNTAEQLYVNEHSDITNKPEKLDSFELMYDGQWNDHFNMKTSFFCNKNSIIAWDGTGSSPLGTLKTLGVEWEGAYKEENFDFGANHSFVKQQYWHLADGLDYSGISYSEYDRPASGITGGNGNDLANWPNQATKLFTNIHLLDKKVTLHGDMRMLWGYEGANDGLDALEDGNSGNANTQNGIRAARHHGVYDPEITANFSLTCRINKSADLTFFVQNIPVMGDNKRYSYSSGHSSTNAGKTSWIEEPTVVGVRYHIRF